jgi:NADPH-dependent glutamate synthase beta subunit-like oxidoreductase/coenzyme F420-reducing hydrogenase delta subunit
VNKGALIIGASPAGLQAAVDLADSGIDVHLTQISPFVGIDSAAAVPRYVLNARILEVAKHPHITLWTRTDVRDTRWIGDSFHVQLHQQPRYVDLDKCTGCGDCMEVCPVTLPGTHNKAIYQLIGLQPECAVIDKLGKVPCTDACPAGIHVQGYVALIAQNRFQEALDLVREAIPFPGICGRICTHPCEVNCRRNEVDKPVAIRQLKRFIADWEMNKADQRQTGRFKKRPPAEDAHQVAIVGAGPAGLTTAYYLAQKGHAVTIFEKLPAAGGMMSVGIPAYRLPRDILCAEIKIIEDMGVDIKTGITFGKDITLEKLKLDGFQAVFLATGLHGSRKLGVDGEELEGVLDGVSFLRDVNFGRKVTLGHKIMVVGGGNVAMDVALSARRLGSRDVTIVCLETREEMPAWEHEIEDVLEAGIEIVNCFGPARFIEKQGKFSGIEFKRCLCVFDDQCNFNPQYDENNLQRLEADTAIVAIGQAGESDFGREEEILIAPGGRIEVDPVTLQTNNPWVFAGGDAVYGPKSVVEAIASGKKAAESIDRYLSGEDLVERRIPRRSNDRSRMAAASGDLNDAPIRQVESADRPMTPIRRHMTDEELVPKPRVAMPVLSLENRWDCFCEVELGYSEDQAVAEAQRCLICGPCSECMACVKVCKPKAIIHEQQEGFIELDFGEIIFADDPMRFEQLPLDQDQHVHRFSPHDLVMASAVAAKVMSGSSVIRHFEVSQPVPKMPDNLARIGVFVCECGETIPQTVDVEEVRKRSAALPGVTCAQVLSSSCTPEGAQTIDELVSALNLNRIVLAACACCSLDQICFSCTYQRIRCKQNLGIFNSRTAAQTPLHLLESVNYPLRSVEFVNIREQCAWSHGQDYTAATTKAAALIAAGVAKIRIPAEKTLEPISAERSTLILGAGKAATICRDVLRLRDIAVQHLAIPPSRIQRSGGCYNAIQINQTCSAQSIVLTPKDPLEANRLVTAFGAQPHRPIIQSIWGGIETHLPGVFYCDPALDSPTVGAAAAARVSAWLNRSAGYGGLNTAVVDRHRCRACSACIEICEFGAPQLVGQEPDRSSWIDPIVCVGCGTCAANCPSGAITAGYSTDNQLEAMIETVLSYGIMVPKKNTVVVFTCNWSAYSGLETAGLRHLSYSPSLHPIKVMCLGRLSPGIILKAFERGAAGVLMLGCPPGECHYESGNCHADMLFTVTGNLMRLLGYTNKHLKMDSVAAGDGEDWVAKATSFVVGLNIDQEEA